MRSLALLALLGSLCLGMDCGPGGPAAEVTLAASPAVLELPLGAVQEFEVLVAATVPIQAFDLAVQVDPPLRLVLGLPEPHPGFDDDGTLFGAPVVEPFAGRVAGIVDLRHGAAAPAGTFGVLRLSALAVSPGEATVRFPSLRFARPDGTLASIATAPVTIRVVAP